MKCVVICPLCKLTLFDIVSVEEFLPEPYYTLDRHFVQNSYNTEENELIINEHFTADEYRANWGYEQNFITCKGCYLIIGQKIGEESGQILIRMLKKGLQWVYK